ncbi:hypothetical protein [Blastopirellula marina]|uniref:Uncharacterized protein n=1 Tax=Blastopirellula marina DSM 3645 TaxID=314230 RepID=A3ZS17_9BACT|nr:hypothetical protein [Blastopirellula marina]EAQ80940.1 hypothetical protein DSM3645_13006 [Blastopirellula marina DSM 3645]
MENQQLPECYSKMFPDVLHLPTGRTVSGKALGVEIQKSGGLVTSGKRVVVNHEQWNACRRCPQFEHCYQLSMAKLALSAAIQ